MATANELFAANGEDYIVIDSDLRTMTFPASVNNIGVENDKDVHKLNFKMPRYFSGYDLSKFIIHINYVNATGDADMYYVLDPTVNENEIIFTWLVGRHACLYRGSVTFIVCLKLADGEGDVAQEFNTTLASLQVLPGLETEPTILETEHDIIEQLLLSINDTNAKIKAVLDTGLTPEQIAEFYNKSKTYDTQITALNSNYTTLNQKFGVALGSDPNFNNIVKQGFYYFGDVTNAVNPPSKDAGYLNMLVLRVSDIATQVVFGGRQLSQSGRDKIWVRYRNGNSDSNWNRWIAYATQSEVDANTAAITELSANGSISIVTPTVLYDRATDVAGGYYKVGRLVYVNVFFTATSTLSNTQGVLVGLPKPYGGLNVSLNAIAIPDTLSSAIEGTVGCGINNANIYIAETKSGYKYCITGVYLSA